MHLNFLDIAQGPVEAERAIRLDDAAEKQTWADECALADVRNLFSAQKHRKLAALRNPLSLRSHWAANAFKRNVLNGASGIITIMTIIALRAQL
jgi:hypothetical protein